MYVSDNNNFEYIVRYMMYLNSAFELVIILISSQIQ